MHYDYDKRDVRAFSTLFHNLTKRIFQVSHRERKPDPKYSRRALLICISTCHLAYPVGQLIHHYI